MPSRTKRSFPEAPKLPVAGRERKYKLVRLNCPALWVAGGFLRDLGSNFVTSIEFEDEHGRRIERTAQTWGAEHFRDRPDQIFKLVVAGFEESSPMATAEWNPETESGELTIYI